MTKQISVTIPDPLYKASQKYTKEIGYKNLQELILDLIRFRTFSEKIDRYHAIEEYMRKGRRRKRPFSKKEALQHMKLL